MTPLALILAALPLFASDTAADIVRRSLDVDNRNWDRAKDYTFVQRSVQRDFDGSGKLKKTEALTHDITIIYGRPFRRLIEKDGKPLSGREEARENERFDKELDKRRRETNEESGKERERYLKRREEQRAFAREIPDAFSFTLAGDQVISGRPVYVITAEPRPGYRPRDTRARFLPKLRGKLWIDKKDYQWVKVEAETTDTISIGLFLARLGPGAVLTFEQQRINDELWLPARAFIKLDARLALLKRMRTEIGIDYRDYRKFSTDSKITAVE